MTESGAAGAWLAAEREFEDEVIGDDALPVMFESAAERYAETPAQRYKGGAYDRSLAGGPIPNVPGGEWGSLTYAEMQSIVRNLSAGFRDLGVDPGDRVAIYADTRMEWALADFALLAAGAVVTTVYTESSTNQVQYLLDDPGATGVVAENETLLDRVHEVEDDLDLSFSVVMDEYESDREDECTLADVHERGAEVFDEAEYQEWLDERDLDDLASLIYTSGTTGKPKGVELTHGNFRANVNQVHRRMGPRPDKADDLPSIEPGDRAISFLPLAHVFERLAGHFLLFASGVTVCYAESPDTLADDMAAVRPNVGASVPRVYERIFDRMREQASESSIKERIFEWAVDVAGEYAQAEDPGTVLSIKHSIADTLVYSTVRQNLGDELKFMVSGGGSLSKELAELFLAMGVPVVEGYGLTETSPVVTTNPLEDVRPGTLGPPVVDLDVRIDESMVGTNQFPDAAGDVGELLVDGPNVTDGYWNRPDETEQSFTEDGYFRTGDIVEVTDDGYLVYKDRLKQIIVLSTGKNVAPEPIEDRFATSDRVDQVMVVGDGEKFVGAVVVPNFETLDRWAEFEGVDLPPSREAKCDDERVREWIREAVEDVNADLEGVERIKAFELVAHEWSADNDLLTPSMKKKRRNIRDAHEEAIEAIYEERAKQPAE